MAATTPCAFVSAEQPPARLERLHRTLCAAAPSLRMGWRPVGNDGAVLALGVPAIDDALGGGLSCGALHEVAAAGETVIVAATGFALALATRMSRCARDGCAQARGAQQAGQTVSTPTGTGVLWVAEDLSLAENGVAYGPGLDQ